MASQRTVSIDTPASEPVRLIAILGSVTAPGRLRRALEEALARAERHTGARTQLLDLADLQIAFADGRPPESLLDDTAAVIELVTAADAVLLATPVYRGSLTGALKNLLDQLPLESLEGKATAIVAMGNTQHHFLGAERHLRDVLAFFGAVLSPVASYLAAEDFSDGAPGERASAELDALLASTIELARLLRSRSESPALRPLVARHGAKPRVVSTT
jgi:FMN reductase